MKTFQIQEKTERRAEEHIKPKGRQAQRYGNEKKDARKQKYGKRFARDTKRFIMERRL